MNHLARTPDGRWMEAKRADFRVYRPLSTDSTSPEMPPNPKPPVNHKQNSGFWPMLLLLSLTLFIAALLIGLVTANFIVSLEEVDLRRIAEAERQKAENNQTAIQKVSKGGRLLIEPFSVLLRLRPSDGDQADRRGSKEAQECHFVERTTFELFS